MGPPIMKRRRMADLNPWIEKLVQNYGKCQNTKIVKAQVIGVSDISESQRLEQTDVCLLFVTDGSAMIPAVLSNAAWKSLRDMDDIISYSALLHTVIFIRSYELQFNMHPDLESCQFYVRVDNLSIYGITVKRPQPYSCTFLSSVKEQIEKTWRSLREDSLSSSPDRQLSSLLDAWHEDVVENIMSHAIETVTITYGQNVATPTHWHRERLRFQGQEQFVVPVPFLLIPEEQREMMTADPSAEREMPICSAPPLEESDVACGNQVIAVQEEFGDLSPDDGPSTLEHTQPEALCRAQDAPREGNTWDIFAAEPALLHRSSTADSSESEQESPSLLKQVHQLPIETSTQFSSRVSEDITLSQRPKPTQFSLSNSAEKSAMEVCLEERFQSPPSWLVHNTILTSGQNLPPAPREALNPPRSSKNQVHSDGTDFSYQYHPKPQDATALGLFQIPGHLLQWAVRYLGISDRADVNAEAGS